MQPLTSHPVLIYTGLMVTRGGMTILHDGLTVTDGLTINTDGLHVTGGVTVYSSGMICENICVYSECVTAYIDIICMLYFAAYFPCSISYFCTLHSCCILIFIMFIRVYTQVYMSSTVA